MGSFGVVIIEFGNFTSGLIASSIFAFFYFMFEDEHEF